MSPAVAVSLVIGVAVVASFVTWLVMRRRPGPVDESAPVPVPVPVPVPAPCEAPESIGKAPKVPAPKLPHRLQPLYEHAREFVLDGDWTRVLSAADVYKNGAYPEYVPDEDMALRLYHICASCPDGEVSGLGQARYIELRLDPVVVEDRRGAPLPRGPGDMIAGEAHERISRTPFERYQTPIRQKIGALERQPAATPRDAAARAAERRRDGNPIQAAIDQIDRVTRFIDGVAGAGAVAERPNGRHHRSDAQNVHDHGVASGVRTSIKEMSGRHGKPTPRGCIEAVQRTRHAILTSEEPEKEKQKALTVLEALTDYTHSSLGASEQEVLALVVKEIDSKADAETRTNLVEMLIKQLASGQERGLVVCSSGKISRIVGTFDGTETFVAEAKPMWAVREEMGTLAARIREKHGDDEKNARDEFIRTANAEYVTKLGMSKHVIQPVISEYSDAF